MLPFRQHLFTILVLIVSKHSSRLKVLDWVILNIHSILFWDLKLLQPFTKVELLIFTIPAAVGCCYRKPSIRNKLLKKTETAYLVGWNPKELKSKLSSVIVAPCGVAGCSRCRRWVVVDTHETPVIVSKLWLEVVQRKLSLAQLSIWVLLKHVVVAL